MATATRTKATTAKKATTVVITDPFRAKGADLRAAAASGNEAAIAELARRAAKHSKES